MRNLCILCALLLSALTFNSCKKDVAKDITPVMEPTHGIQNFLDIMRELPPAHRAEYMRENGQAVNNRLLTYARSQNIIPENARIDSVVYYFGSADAQATDRTGKIFDGKIVDELVAFIYYNSEKKPQGVIVYCTNGTFELFEKDLMRLTEMPLEFTIQRGEGINYHVDFLTSIRLAEYFNLPLFEGKYHPGKKSITPARARELQSDLNEVQVTVLVQPGDHFNLRTMEYTPRKY